MNNNPFLFIGPTTIEAINNINSYSLTNKKKIAFVATRNQIETSDFGRGYVSNLDTKKFSKIIKNYKNSKLLLARDHCGPYTHTNHKINDEINNCIKTINDDISNNFDYIHIDLSNCKNIKNKIEILQKIYDKSNIKNSKIKLEIGIDKHEDVSNFSEIKLCLREFNVPEIEFMTVSNGAYIKENYQIGKYQKKNTNKIKRYLNEKNILIKDHNSDYLEYSEIYSRLADGVNSMNIQPQIAYIENSLILLLAEKLKLFSDLNICYNSLKKNRNIKKWTKKNNKEIILKLGLHYLQNKTPYKKILKTIKNKTDYTYLFKMLTYNILDKYYLAHDSFYTKRRYR